MFNKSFMAFALLHLFVPAVSVALYGANPLWLIGALVFAVATIRSLHENNSVFVVGTLCLISGVAFTLTLMLGTCYYMQGEGFNDAFFYHLNITSLMIAARGYGSVFYPALLGLILAFLAPAFIHRTQTSRVWPSIPVLLLWVLALVGNFPIYSLVNYQASLSNDMVLPGRSLVAAPRLNPEQGTPGADKPLPGHTESAISKPDDSQQDVLEKISPVDETTSDNLSPVMNPTGQAPATPVEAEPESLPTTLRESPVEARQEKNIILIYAESLESLYFDIALFGDLLPNIRTLSVNAHRFTNLVQVGGTGWTIAGIVASQCGFPLKVSTHLASNSSMASVEKPYPDEQCLADILSDRGYQTTYMGGAPLWFAGKENFLRTHGYQSIFGDEELAARLPDKKYQSGWGFYDDSLFKLALGELESLEKEAQPYLLTLLTLDTHHPNGIPSGSCKKLPDNQNSMSNSIYCSDQLIGGFITEAMKTVDMNNTIIVLFSDHLSLRNTLWDKLKENKPHRRLTFMIFDDQPATVSDIRATHFDVAPTILEAAGFTDHLRVGAGISLLSASPGGQVAQKTITTPTLLDPVASAKESGVAISRKELSLRIGDLTLKANYHGQEFVSGMYLVVLDDKGHVMDAIYADDYQRLAKNLNGSFVVGISVMPGPPYSASYFYGFISPDGRGIRQHSFTYDVHLSATDLWPPQN